MTLRARLLRLASEDPHLRPHLARLLRASDLTLQDRFALVLHQHMTELVAEVSRGFLRASRGTQGLGFALVAPNRWEARWQVPIAGTFRDREVGLTLTYDWSGQAVSWEVRVDKDVEKGSASKAASPKRVVNDIIKAALKAVGGR